MNVEQKRDKAHSYDLDDTLIRREGLARGMGLISGTLKSHSFPLYDISNLPSINREIIDEPLSTVAEKVSYIVHSHRYVVPSALHIIEQDQSEGIDIYGNTGRSNKRSWVIMTAQTLKHGGIIDYFRDVFYTPEGIKTAVSKAAAIKDLFNKYENVSHFDDDPRTAAYLASLFPNLEVYLLQYGSTGLLYSREELNKFPNIHRIGSLIDLIK